MPSTGSKKINLVVSGINFCESETAGSIRVRNLLDSFFNDPNYSITNLDLEKAKNKGEKIETVNIIYLKGIKKILSSRRILKELKKNNQSSILFNYGPPSIENILIILFARSLRYKVHFDIVEDYFTYTEFKSFKSRVKGFSRKFLLKRIYRFADSCSVISNRLLVNMNKLSKDHFQAFILPISVRSSEFEITSPSSSHNKIILFYGGSFGEKDGLYYLLNAFDQVAKEYNNIELHLSGKGPERNLTNVNEIIKTLVHKDKVIIMGYLGRKEYILELFKSDILCMTRTNSTYSNSGFPFKLGEYLAAGKAIICSDVSDISFYLKDKVDLVFVKPESTDSLYKELKVLIQDSELRSKLGVAAKKKVNELFDSITVSNQLKSRLNSLVQN